MKPFQKLVVRVFGIKFDDQVVKFNVEQALREQRRQGKEEGIELGKQEKPDCLICPLYRNTHPRDIVDLEPQGPTTDGKIAAQQMDKAPIVPQPRGRYFQSRHREFADTHILPPVHITRDLRHLIHGDGEQERKIS